MPVDYIYSPVEPGIVETVRRMSGVTEEQGPTDDQIFAGVQGFVEAFDYWYIRVLRQAVPKYRNLVVSRINPFIRRAELSGLGARESSIRLVEDWARRNFVTAGGWALEELAIASSPKLQKSAAEGMDAQSYSSATGQYQLYVLKSGLVTRNSDIVKAIKTHGRQAEKLLRQGRGTNGVQLNYVILAGKTNSTFQDGVYRPSSAEFWAEALNLPENDAIELALAMAAEAGQLVKRDASVHLKAMETLVATYLRTLDGRDVLDWDFVSKRNMRDKATWSAEDKRRHKLALAALEDSGYNPDVEEDEAALQVAKTVADLEPTPEDVGLF